MDANNITTDNTLHAIFAGKAFLYIKQCLSIDKMLFHFVSKQNGKDKIDIYIDAAEFAVLMEDVNSGNFAKLLAKDKAAAAAENSQYAKASYTSPIGGSMVDGKLVARYITIEAGAHTEMVIKGMLFNASESEGKTVPQGKPIKQFMIGCSYRELRKCAWKWEPLGNAYRSRKYTEDNLVSAYIPKEEEIATPPETQPVPKTEPPKEPEAPKSAPAPQPTPTAPQEPASTTANKPVEQPNAEEPKEVTVKVITSGPMTAFSGGFYGNATLNNELVHIVFPTEKYKAVDEDTWNRFITGSETQSVAIPIVATVKTSKDGKATYYLERFNM